jgi:hypothetical protein
VSDEKQKETIKEVEKVDEIPEAKEVIKSLTTQLKEFRERALYFNKMILKAEGALEVLLQLHPEKESDES